MTQLNDRKKARCLLFIPAVLFLLSMAAIAQDADAVLTAAAKAMGATVHSIQYSGNGNTYFFGQAIDAQSGWPRMVLKNYVADVHYAPPAMRQELYRTEPDGGVPFGGNRQIQLVSGPDAWNVGANDQPVPAVALAAERGLQVWLTPHGFIHAALGNRATVTRKGAAHVVAFTLPDRYRVTGVINAQNLVERIDTAIPHPVLGDMPVEITFSKYQTFGDVKFPMSIVQRQGGHPILELTVTEVKPNGARQLDVPANVLGAKPAPMRVASSPIGERLWHVAGASHHSVLAEFADHLAVVEAPQHEERSLAVIAEVRKLVPNKPIRYVVNTHQHFDHSGGLRTYAANGATIVTAAIYKPYFERVYANPHTIMPDLLAKSKVKPVIEGVSDRRVFSDGTQAMEVHVLRGSPHNAGLVVAYFPKQKTLVQADVFTPPPPDAPPPAKPDPAALNLYENIQRLKLDVEQIAPIHGRVAKIEELRKAVGR